MKITEEMVDYVSILARLKLPQEEKTAMAAQLEGIVAYMDVLNGLDTSGVEPMVQPWEIGNVFREDEVTNGDMREELLAGAPAREDGQYVVPRTVE